MKKESDFQGDLIKEIQTRIPGSLVLKNDEQYLQGMPDLTVLLPGGCWAVLECKRKKPDDSDYQPNQKYYLNKLKSIGGYTATVFPENKDGVINELEKYSQI